MTLARRTELRRTGWWPRRKPLRRTVPRRARPGEPLADWCEAAIPGVCTGRAVHRHHIRRRSQGGGDEATNTTDLCGACHGHIHANTGWAYEHGFLRRKAETS